MSAIEDSLYDCARWMTTPLWNCVEWVFRLRYSHQFSSTLSEKVNRIWLALKTIFLLPLALTFWLCAAAPKAIANNLQENPYTYLSGTDIPPLIEEQRKTILSVFTLNTCFMPGGMSLAFGGVAPASERVNSIAKKILQVDSDVVCLQEAHDEAAVLALYEKLKGRYSHFYVNIGPSTTFDLNSGLFIASKFEVKNFHFERFEQTLGNQKKVKKGFVDFDLYAKEKPIAHIFNTHLMPSKEDSAPSLAEQQTRSAQLDQIVKRIHQIFQRTYPIVLAGDLNMDSPEAEKSLSSRSFIDGLKCKGRPATCTEYFTRYIKAKTEQERAKLIPEKGHSIDYTLLYDNPQFQIQSDLIPMYDTSRPAEALSDHHGIKTEIFLKQ